MNWPRSKQLLCDLGINRIEEFCKRNGVPVPPIHVIHKKSWRVSACAYYRPEGTSRLETGICICLEYCAHPATQDQARNWNWPGSTTDREPYGVLCHELGHHCDWWKGERKWEYGSEYHLQVMQAAQEEPLTSYHPNPAEWFAEMFRLFVSNPDLLRQVRPRTYRKLCVDWSPIPGTWKDELGRNCPPRIVTSLQRKGAK